MKSNNVINTKFQNPYRCLSTDPEEETCFAAVVVAVAAVDTEVDVGVGVADDT